MTTKLEAINTMLSCIGQAPLNTLNGTKSYFTIAAEHILEDEVKRFQLQGWDFNSEDDYQLNPDINNKIVIPPNLIMVKFPTLYKNRYVVREGKLYDKFEHTYDIPKPIRCSVIWCFDFEDLPEVAKEYAKISAAYKFVKRELGAEKTTQYTQEDVLEARIALEQHELEIGEYTMIPDMYNGNIKESI
jgi:hypothetical protein